MTLPLSGTAAVEEDSDVLTWTGAPLSPLNCVPGATIALDGLLYFVAEPLGTTQLRLTRNYADATGTVPAEIEQLSPNQVATATLNKRAAEVMSQISALDANGRGLFYNLIGVTGANDPGPGNLAFNAINASDVSEIYFDVLDANDGGRDVSSLIDLWRAGTVLTLRSLATTAYAAFQISAVETVAGWRKVVASYIGSDGELGTEPLAVDWNIIGEGVQINRAGTFAQRGLYDTEENPAPVRFTYASIDGADGAGPPTVLYIKQSATHDDWGPAIPFQGPESEPRVAVAVWDPGRPGAGEVVWTGIFDVPVSFPANLNGVNAVSRAVADVVPTSAAAYSIRRNGVQFATLTFGAGSTNGIFAGAAADFAAGDRLSIVAPNPRDATLAQIAITLAGAR